jgi:hypothetical protein
MLVLWAQVGLGETQNALVTCMVCCSVAMFAINNLTTYGKYRAQYLIIAIIIFAMSTGVQFLQPILGYQIAPRLTSFLVLLSIASGVFSIAVSVSRSRQYRREHDVHQGS